MAGGLSFDGYLAKAGKMIRPAVFLAGGRALMKLQRNGFDFF